MSVFAVYSEKSGFIESLTGIISASMSMDEAVEEFVKVYELDKFEYSVHDIPAGEKSIDEPIIDGRDVRIHLPLDQYFTYRVIQLKL